jgi:hypothetical protein
MVSVEYQAFYSAEVAFVCEALTDRAFLDAYATEIGALRWDATIDEPGDGIRTRLAMTVPTNGVPAAFKRFVTPTVDIVETRVWNAHGVGVGVGVGVGGTVAVDAAVGKREARVRGTVALVPEVQGCRFTFAGDIVVNLRLVGEPAALLVKELVRKVLSQQTKVMERWIAA